MKKPFVNLFICLALLVLGLGSVSCSEHSNAALSLEVVDVDAEAAAKLVEDSAVVVLDVRTPEEFSLGHIASALNHNINGDGFEDAVKSLDHSKTYLVHCAMGAAGGRSRNALKALEAAGATKVYHLNGGFVAWQQAANPTEKIVK